MQSMLGTRYINVLDTHSIRCILTICLNYLQRFSPANKSIFNKLEVPIPLYSIHAPAEDLKVFEASVAGSIRSNSFVLLFYSGTVIFSLT